nr:uncharacterized protein LOC105732116 [Aotus nancymaae]
MWGALEREEDAADPSTGSGWGQRAREEEAVPKERLKKALTELSEQLTEEGEEEEPKDTLKLKPGGWREDASLTLTTAKYAKRAAMRGILFRYINLYREMNTDSRQLLLSGKQCVRSNETPC